MSKVYLDMDGVLADFDKALIENGISLFKDSRLLKQEVSKKDWTKEELDRDSKVHHLMSQPGFFRNLEMMTGADQLWVTAGKPIVLTARPKNDESAHRVCKEKREWIEEYFGQIPEDRFICCLRSEKSFYASTSMTRYTGEPHPNILVDDLEWNCLEWKEAGGIAIHFKTMDQAIRDLKELVSRIKK